MTIENLILASKTANHCQRNWDKSVNVPTEHVNGLIEIATNMPTKQNVEYFRLVVSTDQTINRQLYNFSVDPDNPDTIDRNAQSDAHVVFMWFNTHQGPGFTDMTNAEGHYDPWDLNVRTAIGISSGAVALSACQLGYKTGYNQCFLNSEIKELISSTVGITPSELGGIELLLGIGVPVTGVPWNYVLDDNNELVRTVEPRTKNLTTYTIGL